MEFNSLSRAMLLLTLWLSAACRSLLSAAVILIGKWHGFWSLSGTYGDGASGGFNDIVGDGGRL